MCRYIVLDYSDTAREVVLLDAYGKLHLVRWQAERPATGDVMHGPCAALGFHVLSAEVTHRAHATQFVLISCQLQAVRLRWAAWLPLARVPERSSRRPLQAGATEAANAATHNAQSAPAAGRRRAGRPAHAQLAPVS